MLFSYGTAMWLSYMCFKNALLILTLKYTYKNTPELVFLTSQNKSMYCIL